MVDIVDKKKRSLMMANIKGRNTKPELLIRSGLHRLGYRYILHDKRLPGKPDIVFRRRKAVIFVNGCFWHGHDCSLFKWPSTRAEWWREKIEKNRVRDKKVYCTLKETGWRQAHIWECALKGKNRYKIENVIQLLSEWLDSENANIEIMENS